MPTPKVDYKPKQYRAVTPYLTVADAQKTIDFATQVLGAELIFEMKTPDGSISHAELKIDDSVIMVGQAGGPFTPTPASLYIYVPDVDATYKKALSAGAKSEREPADQFYGDRNANVVDDNGTRWSFGTHVEDVSPEEMTKRAAALKAA
jgi:PhnB protein